MFAWFEGIVDTVAEDRCVLSVQGVGYELIMHVGTLQSIRCAQTLRVYVHQQVREDAHTLYGFLSDRERDFFRLLLQASGVGPKLALTLLAALGLDDLLRAVQTRDVDTLRRVKGVGSKMAEKLALDLCNRCSDWHPLTLAAASVQSDSVKEAISALTNLGYSVSAAKKVVDTCYQDGMDSENLLKLSLRALA